MGRYKFLAKKLDFFLKKSLINNNFYRNNKNKNINSLKITRIIFHQNKNLRTIVAKMQFQVVFSLITDLPLLLLKLYIFKIIIIF